MTETKSTPTSGQERIWSHFQNRASESFDAAAPRMKALVKWMRHDFSKGKQPTILNIGVGSGMLEQLALDAKFKVSSLDPDAEAMGRLTCLGVDAHAGYIEKMPFGSQTFDYVIASEVVEHLSDESRRAGYQEIIRVLDPTGCLLVTVPYNENLALSEVICPDCGKIFHRWGHKKSFTVRSLGDELRLYFSDVAVFRTAFVDLGGGVGRKVKSLLRLILARSGQMIAVPSLFAICRKPRNA